MARGRQLQALLRRVALGKADGWKGSLIELALPVAFASLLVLVKSIADVYDSPAVAYSCGPARPFDESTPTLGELGWLGCYVRPELPACPIDTYLLRQTFLLALSPFRSRDIFDGAGTLAPEDCAHRGAQPLDGRHPPGHDPQLHQDLRRRAGRTPHRLRSRHGHLARLEP